MATHGQMAWWPTVSAYMVS